MPQISLPEIHLSEISGRLQEAADELRLPEEVRERLDDAGTALAEAGRDISEAAGRFGSEMGERLGDVKWPAIALPAALAALTEMKPPKVDVSVDTRELRKAVSEARPAGGDDRSSLVRPADRADRVPRGGRRGVRRLVARHLRITRRHA